jgi:hypothetical protein
LRGADQAPPGAWILAKGLIGYGSPIATWCLGKPEHHLALRSWQNARMAIATQPPCGASHCYYNIITYNKNSIIYTTTDNIFSIHPINYK